MSVRGCHLKHQWPLSLPHGGTASLVARRHFHPSHPRLADPELPNHYATLGLESNATQGDVKKQFYNLSKAYHPDSNSSDPTTSEKFVKVSEAYATLGSPEKRRRYDKDFLRTQQPSTPYSSGSFSSASSPAGGRAPSGLSRRRTHFQGPPPSFYRNGGWGEHSAKRAENAEKASHAHEAQGQAQSNKYDTAAGTGPGGFTSGFDNDVPHFDRRRHYQTHSTIEKNRYRSRRKRHTGFEGLEDLDLPGSGGGPSVLFNFMMITATLGISVAVSGLLVGGRSVKARRNAEEG